MVGVPFVCQQRSWGRKVVERDAQETEVCVGERSEFFEESMVARLQQKRARGRVRVSERLSEPCVGGSSGRAEARKDRDDDFRWRGVHPPLGDERREERRAGAAGEEDGP